MKRGRAFVGLGAVVVPVLGACSLGLDPSLIGADAGDAGGGDGTTDGPPGPPPGDGGHDALPEGDAQECGDAGDCASSDPCRVGRCAAGRCVYDVCPTTTACQGSTCTATGCSAPTTYGFHAATIHVGAGPVGCGGDPTRCLAAVYPFVFVGTANGVVAYATNDPSNASPKVVPITGLPFLPSWILSSGSRVYFVGPLAGAGPTYKVAMATIDVPSDPLASPLVATSVFDTYTEPRLDLVYPSSAGGLFLINADAAHFFPTGRVVPPLKDADTIVFAKSPGVPTDAFPVVASGARIVNARWTNESGAYATYLSLETKAGTPSAQNAGEQGLFATMGPTTQQSTYGQGADGAVLWNTGSTFIDDSGTPQVRSAKMAWVLADATSTNFSADAAAEVEKYEPPVAYGTVVAGPIVAVDSSQALVLASAANQLAQTSVQLVLKGSPPTVAPSQRRTIVPVAVTAVGAASSGGFGYVLANDAPDSCTLHAFAPACAGP